MAKPVSGTPPTTSTMGNAGGAVRGQARAAQVQARNAARQAARPPEDGDEADRMMAGHGDAWSRNPGTPTSHHFG